MSNHRLSRLPRPRAQLKTSKKIKKKKNLLLVAVEAGQIERP